MFNLSPYDIYGKNYGMQLDAMCFLSNLYNDKVLYFFGDMTRYSYSDILTLSSHPNISRYPMQTNVNFIMEGLQSAEVVFTMDERFSEYCRHVGVKTVIFGRDDEYQTDKVLYININKTDDIDRMFVGCKYDKIKNFIES